MEGQRVSFLKILEERGIWLLERQKEQHPIIDPYDIVNCLDILGIAEMYRTVFLFFFSILPMPVF